MPLPSPLLSASPDTRGGTRREFTPHSRQLRQLCQASLTVFGRLARITLPLLAAAAAVPAVAEPDAAATARTAAALDRVAADPPALRVFLAALPKGADLHNHEGGSIWAEDWLRWAAADGLCIAVDPPRLVLPPCAAPGRIPAAGIERDYPLYSRMIDAFSTRGAGTGEGAAGADRFFATFAAFWPASHGHEGEMLALTRDQAATDRVSYVEYSVGSGHAGDVAAGIDAVDPADFAALMAFVAPRLPAAVAAVRADYDGYEADAARRGGCGTATPQPACGVEVRYLYQALRTFPPGQVFAQLALGFALAAADPRFAGVNIAAPEHDPVAIRDYRRHMAMIVFLKTRYPTVNLSLHAGELTLGLVPPRDLAFHIRAAVAAGAQRIGHGVDIADETDAPALLRAMAAKRVAVEINLTSNAVILGVQGRAHPLALYRAAGVPVVLSTDDEGVSRSDMTNEYVRAVTEQGLRYADLKQIVRDGLQYSFLPGASLWADRAGGAVVAACRVAAAPACAAFRAASPKAAKQAALEHDLAAFEASQ